ncbi:hypothetical protein CR513_60128, partial [Mucuna pruriens]
MENYIDRKMKEKQGRPTEPFSFVPTSNYRTTFQQPSSAFFSPSPKTWTLPTAGAYRIRTKPESISGISREKPTNQSLHNSPESSPERQLPSSHEKQTIPEKDDFLNSQDPHSQFTVKLCPVDEPGYSSPLDTKESQSEVSSENYEEGEKYEQPESSSESSEEEKDDAIYDSEEEVISSPPQHGPPKPNSGSWFTLDDIPPNKWRSRLIKFGAWLDTKILKDSDPYKVIEEFCCQMTGTLKAWNHNLGAIRQDQLHNLGTTAAVLGVLHEEFIGDGKIIEKKIRQECFEIRWCSIRIKDLNKHFQRMLTLGPQFGPSPLTITSPLRGHI